MRLTQDQFNYAMKEYEKCKAVVAVVEAGGSSIFTWAARREAFSALIELDQIESRKEKK